MGVGIRYFDFVTFVTVLISLSGVGAFFEDLDESSTLRLHRVKRVMNGKTSEPGRHPFVGNLQVSLAKRYCPLLVFLDPMEYFLDCYNVSNLEVESGCNAKENLFNIYQQICLDDIKLEINSTTELCKNASEDTNTKFAKLRSECLESHLPVLKNKSECHDLRDELADYLERCAVPGEARQKPLAATWMSLCSATLVTSQGWMLTAAHCFNTIDDLPIKYWRIVLGESDLDAVEDGSQQTHALAEVVIHEDYYNHDNGSKQNDVGLIRLSAPVSLTPMVQVVYLAEPEDDVEGEECTVMGWGQTSSDTENPARARTLQEAQVRRANFSACQEWALEFGDVKPTYQEDTCTQPLDGPHTSLCYGDSGGPLVCGTGDRVIQVGVASAAGSDDEVEFGDCIGEYNIFTKVSAYREWIEGHVCQNNTSCLPRAPAKQPDTHGGDFVTDAGQTQHSAHIAAVHLLAAFGVVRILTLASLGQSF